MLIDVYDKALPLPYSAARELFLCVNKLYKAVGEAVPLSTQPMKLSG